MPPKKIKDTRLTYNHIKEGTTDRVPGHLAWKKERDLPVNILITPDLKQKFINELEVHPPSGVLGYDASVGSSGWCYSTTYGKYAVGDFGNSYDGTYRLSWVIKAIQDLLLRFMPTKIYLEDYSLQSKFPAYVVWELGGMIRILFHEYIDLVNNAMGEPIVSLTKITPTELKKFVTGKGVADKDIMMLELLNRFKTYVPHKDQADATGLCIMGLKGYTPAPVVKKVRKPKDV